MRPTPSLDDETAWSRWYDHSGEVVAFPARLRRFVAVEVVPGTDRTDGTDGTDRARVREDRYRARVFVGWHPDPSIGPSARFRTYADARKVAEKGAHKLGLPFVGDRCSVTGHGVWSAPKRVGEA